MRTIICFLLIGMFFSSAPIMADVNVLYCVENDATGFKVDENYKRTLYKNKRFQLKVDFQNETMISEKIWLKSQVECIFESLSGTMYCTSIYGTTLALHKKSLKFHYSSMILAPGESTDDIVLSHGACENF